MNASEKERKETLKQNLVSSVYKAYICARFMKKVKTAELILKSRELFTRFGVKSLTMDDIARELGMSKKTIYLLVYDKNDLVNKTMESYLLDEQLQMKAIIASSKDSVDEMIKMIEYIMNVIREFNPSALYDLQKYYPETWKMFNEYRFNFALGMIHDNIKKGIMQGVYRSDMDADVIARIYISGVDITLDQALFPQKKYQFSVIYKEFLNYHLRGIVSPKGLKYLEQHNLFKS